MSRQPIFTPIDEPLGNGSSLSSRPDTWETARGKIEANLQELYDNPLHPGYVASRFYAPFQGNIAAGAATGANSIRLMPLPLPKAITVSELAVKITTLDAAGHFELAIYNSHPTTKYPTTLIANTNEASTASAAAVSTPFDQGNTTLQPGLHWLASNTDSATVVFVGVALASIIAQYWVGTPNAGELFTSATNGGLVHTFGQAYGTWPDLTGQTLVRVTTATWPYIGLKAA